MHALNVQYLANTPYFNNKFCFTTFSANRNKSSFISQTVKQHLHKSRKHSDIKTWVNVSYCPFFSGLKYMVSFLPSTLAAYRAKVNRRSDSLFKQHNTNGLVNVTIGNRQAELTNRFKYLNVSGLITFSLTSGMTALSALLQIVLETWSVELGLPPPYPKKICEIECEQNVYEELQVRWSSPMEASGCCTRQSTLQLQQHDWNQIPFSASEFLGPKCKEWRCKSSHLVKCTEFVAIVLCSRACLPEQTHELN